MISCPLIRDFRVLVWAFLGSVFADGFSSVNAQEVCKHERDRYRLYFFVLRSSLPFHGRPTKGPWRVPGIAVPFISPPSSSRLQSGPSSFPIKSLLKHVFLFRVNANSRSRRARILRRAREQRAESPVFQRLPEKAEQFFSHSQTFEISLAFHYFSYDKTLL